MKKIVLAAVLAAFGSASAFAADLAPRSYTKAPALSEPVSSWQGVYIGGNIGYGWGRGTTDFSFIPAPLDLLLANTTLANKPKGVIGGVQAGYNWQTGSLITGFEADVQGSGISGSVQPTLLPIDPLFGVTPTAKSDQNLTWFGTVRGRVGVTATPNLLIYATGGLAYGQIDASANLRYLAITVFNFPASVSKIKAGWTAGGGAEWMFAHNWSTKIEYLYLDLGDVSAFGAVPAFARVGYTWHTQDHIVRAGVNYHF